MMGSKSWTYVLVTAFSEFARPVDWRKNVWELDPNNRDNNGFQNEDLIVWMRTAALPTFRKLYRRVNHSKPGFTDGLPKGNYTLFVKYCKSVVSCNVFVEDIKEQITQLLIRYVQYSYTNTIADKIIHSRVQGPGHWSLHRLLCMVADCTICWYLNLPSVEVHRF
jgi:hypothetical protein